MQRRTKIDHGFWLLALLVACWAGQAGATGASFEPTQAFFSGGRDVVALGDFDGDDDLDVVAGSSYLFGSGVFLHENDGGHPATYSMQPALGGGITVAIEAADLVFPPDTTEFVSASGGEILLWVFSGGTLTSIPLGTADALGLDPYPAQDRVYAALGTDLGYAPISGTGVVTGGLGAAADTYRAIAVGSLAGGVVHDIVAAGAGGIVRCDSVSVCSFVIDGTVDAYDVEIADLDGDGDSDLVAGLNDQLVWYEYDTTAYPGPDFFSPPLALSAANVNALWTDVEVVDFDMDGDLDVVATDAADGGPLVLGDGAVAWFENDGAADPGFTRSNIASFVTTSSVGSPSGVAAGDVDGDGDPDVVYGASNSFLITLSFVGVESNQFATWWTDGESPDSTGTGIAAAGGVDVNGDGWPDQLIGGDCLSGCTGRVDLYLGTADGVEETPAWSATGDGPIDYFGRAVAFLGDVNADGFQDIGVSAPRHANSDCEDDGRSVGEVFIWYGGAPGVGDPTGFGPDGTRANADVRLTGRTNTLWAGTCEFSPSQACGSDAGCVPFGGGTCVCQPPQDSAFGVSLLGIGDRDGDGIDDFLVGDPAYFSNNCFPLTRRNWGRVTLFKGSSTGTFDDQTFGLPHPGSSYCSSCPCDSASFGAQLAAGDIDGDQLADFAVSVPFESETHVYLASDFGVSQVLTEGGRGVAIGDVDGDDYDDVIAVDPSSAHAFTGSASGVLSASGWTYATSPITGVSVVGDLNADCREDVVIPTDSTSLAVFYGEDTAQGLESDPLEIMPAWNVASRAGDVRRDGFDDFLTGEVMGGRYGATAGAAAVYQGSGHGSPPGDCDGDGSNRALDCNDDDPNVFPGATEICDGIDNDCSGVADDGPDSDGDGPNDVCDNCPTVPNGPLAGTCTAGAPALIGEPCTTRADCGGLFNFCSRAQNDVDGDGVGDACDPDTVPEPATGLLLSVGGVFLGAVTRRRSRLAA